MTWPDSALRWRFPAVACDAPSQGSLPQHVFGPHHAAMSNDLTWRNGLMTITRDALFYFTPSATARRRHQSGGGAPRQ